MINKNSTIWGIVALIAFLAVLSVSDNAIAGDQTGEWSFQCSRHGFREYKNCWGQEQLFANGQTFYAAATSFQFVGHRHGRSDIWASVCLYLGSKSQCRSYHCTGGNCGPEYGGQHPFDYLDGGGFTLWDNSAWGKVYYTAAVEDAEVRNEGSWSVHWEDPIYGCTDSSATNYNSGANTNDGSCTYCAAGYGNSCTSSANACGQTSTGTIQCNGSCSASTPSNPPGYGNSCTGATSSPNACGQTNPGGSGTIQCNGSCSGSTGSTPANPPGYGNSCTSSANACGQTNTGTIQCNGSCSASTPPNSACPVPSVDINANPSTINWNQSSALSWSSSNATSCNASGDWSGSKPLSGSESTGNLIQVRTHTYTLTCSVAWGSGQDTASVVVNPPIPITSSVSVVAPNYCTTGPSITANWSFSDPSGSPQSAYQVQVDNQPSFNSPEFDSGKTTCQNCRSYYGGLGILQFNTTYNARVRTWNTYDSPSAWQEATSCSGTDCQPNGSWKTPNHAYPNVNSPYQFTRSPINPPIGQPVQFTDKTLFAPSSNNKQWLWTFVPAGGGSGSSTAQNPVYTFNSEGIYQVTESVRDNAMSSGQYCTGPTQAVNVQKPIPVWKEVAPK
ncbi:MAG: PKD domain-containing protein [Candidatus Yanofskybacteria bacterium]|nr:PKD domain-containing protein [Candidatus Yanofskybacteria bacterium]